MSALLSKSDFKVAQTCPTKLFYKKNRYPSSLDDDEYLELLAEGGFMVEKIAKTLFPDGIEVPFDGNYDAAAKATSALSKTRASDSVVKSKSEMLSSAWQAERSFPYFPSERSLGLIKPQLRICRSSSGLVQCHSNPSFLSSRKSGCAEWISFASFMR
ncbi:MAG TPA: hypothetical protein VH280_13040 [Verrucomicrobiae bacterium]|jgi:hypothetical protein|nr:hypothetical protein [Verrucomicrobiae bacterium]